MDTTHPTQGTGGTPEAGLQSTGTTVPPRPALTRTGTADGGGHGAVTDATASAGDASGGAKSTGAVSEDQVKLALRRVKDPDLNLNIVDLGLVYGIRVDGSTVHVDVTLTSPGCPAGPEIITGAEQEIQTLPGVEQVRVNLIWTPFWTPDRIEPRVRAYLGL